MNDLRADLASLLEERASELPDRAFLALAGGVRLTFGEFNREVNRVAHGLAELVRPGDRVACMLPNSLESLLVSYALKKLAAVEVAVNTDFAAQDSRACSTRARPRCSSPTVISSPTLSRSSRSSSTCAPSWSRGATRASRGGARRARRAHQRAHRQPALAAIADTDLMSVLFTSGTTGQAKGCMLSHRYAVRMATGLITALELRAVRLPLLPVSALPRRRGLSHGAARARARSARRYRLRVQREPLLGARSTTSARRCSTSWARP